MEDLQGMLYPYLKPNQEDLSPFAGSPSGSALVFHAQQLLPLVSLTRKVLALPCMHHLLSALQAAPFEVQRHVSAEGIEDTSQRTDRCSHLMPFPNHLLHPLHRESIGFGTDIPSESSVLVQAEDKGNFPR